MLIPAHLYHQINTPLWRCSPQRNTFNESVKSPLLIFHRSLWEFISLYSNPSSSKTVTIQNTILIPHLLAMMLHLLIIFSGPVILKCPAYLLTSSLHDLKRKKKVKAWCGIWSWKRTKWWSEKDVSQSRAQKKTEARRLHFVTPIWDINGKGKRLLVSSFWRTLALHLITLGKGHPALFLTMTTLCFSVQCIIGLCLALICIIKEAWCSR